MFVNRINKFVKKNINQTLNESKKFDDEFKKQSERFKQIEQRMNDWDKNTKLIRKR